MAGAMAWNMQKNRRCLFWGPKLARLCTFLLECTKRTSYRYFIGIRNRDNWDVQCEINLYPACIPDGGEAFPSQSNTAASWEEQIPLNKVISGDLPAHLFAKAVPCSQSPKKACRWVLLCPEKETSQPFLADVPVLCHPGKFLCLCGIPVFQFVPLAPCCFVACNWKESGSFHALDIYKHW